jgi:hypothetical protein
VIEEEERRESENLDDDIPEDFVCCIFEFHLQQIIAVMKYKAALAEDGRILGMKIDVLADSAVYLLPVAAVLALVGIRLNSMEKRRRVGTKKKGRPAAAFLLPPEKTSKFVKVSVVPCRFAAVFQNLQA